MGETWRAQTSEAGQIAWFLGLPSKLSDLELVERVKRGFPVKTADTIVRRVDPDGTYLQVSDIIPKSTYHRRIKAKQPLSRDESARVLSLARVFVEIYRQYRGETRQAAHFLVREHQLLGGRTPLDVAKESTAGADLVLKILQQADAGVAV